MEVIAGTAKFLTERGIFVLEEPATQAGSVVHVARDGAYFGLFVLKDRLRQTAPSLVAYFGEQGIAVTLLSGDRPEHVREIARAAGIDDARGGMLPADKAGYVTEREGEGEAVLMVGDGINDAPALSAASVGCAMAGGADIALETSSLILTKPDLGRIRLAHQLSVRTMRVIRQNLAWAFIYNLIGIPLAMTGRLTPIYAAAAMALSSLCVVGNSLRLTRLKRDEMRAQ
jgi:Cu2+-exporting ATPase